MPRRERTDREERILWRGKSLGRDYTDYLRRVHGAENVLAEVKITWPLGVGHMDAFIVPTKTAVEVVSSKHATDNVRWSKLLQLCGYMEHADFEIDSGLLVVVDPSDFTDERFSLAKTSRAYRALVGEMRDRVAQVQAWAGDGAIPARVCARPSDSFAHFCLFADHCFQGWEPPELPELESEETRTLVAALYRLKQREHEARQEIGVLASERKLVEQELEERVPVGKHRVGPLEVHRSRVVRKPTFQWEKAEMAGVFQPDLYAEFFRAGAEYDVWRVDRNGDMPLPAEDYGEVPF